nr:hypothetical protein [Tanacetum cinerariifolium]
VGLAEIDVSILLISASTPVISSELHGSFSELELFFIIFFFCCAWNFILLKIKASHQALIPLVENSETGSFKMINTLSDL